MTLASNGNLAITNSFNAPGAVTSGYIHSTGNVGADARVIAGGDINGSAIYGPNGVFAGNYADTYFGLFRGTNVTNVQHWPNWYWQFQTTTNNLIWVGGGSNSWVIEGSGGRACYCPTGPVGGNGAYFLVSDERLKSNIAPSRYGGAEIMKLNPVSFTRDAAEARTEIGFIAQDVQKILPEAVRELDMDGEPTLVLSDSMITAALVNAYKELVARVAQLEAR
jgi:hypothetical protein